MRIIGGTARGKKLIAPEGADTRPTADRIRESLFNLLMGRVSGARTLDLFAGTGALTAEALSRGAASAVCADISPAACAIVRRNVDLKGVSGVAQVLCGDWRSILPRLVGPFDLVFLDPPYRMEEVYGQAFSTLLGAGLLAEGAVVVMETAADARIPLPPSAEVYDSRKYGATRLLLARANRERADA